MNLIKKIFGAEKTVDDIFDRENGILMKAGSFVNNLHLSDAEKLQHDAQEAQNIREFVKATMNENTDRSKTRRRLAIKWFEMHISIIKLYVFTIFLDKLAQLLERPLTLAPELETVVFSGVIWSLTSGIGLFFWGSHALRSSKFAKGE